MKKSFYFIFLNFVFLFGCTTEHYYYIQNVQQVPLFKEKKEVRLSGSIGGGNVLKTTGAQAAYSITNHLAVSTNMMFSKMTGGNTPDWSKGEYYDGAAGYFKDFKKYGVFELYAGVGSSSQHHVYNEEELLGFTPFFLIPITRLEYRGTADVSYLKYFAQANYGLSYNSYDVALSTKISDLYFNKVNNHIVDTLYAHSEIERMKGSRHSIVIEPAITIRGGWKYVKAQLQFAYTGMINNSSFRFDSYNLSLGINIAIAKRYWYTPPKG